MDPENRNNIDTPGVWIVEVQKVPEDTMDGQDNQRRSDTDD